MANISTTKPSAVVINRGDITVINRGDILDSELDRGEPIVKNRFRWEWLIYKDAHGDFFSNYIRKIKVNGEVWCTICKSTISYGSSGLKSLQTHSRTKKHSRARNVLINTSQALPVVYQKINKLKSEDVDDNDIPVTETKTTAVYGQSPNIPGCVSEFVTRTKKHSRTRNVLNTSPSLPKACQMIIQVKSEDVDIPTTETKKSGVYGQSPNISSPAPSSEPCEPKFVNLKARVLHQETLVAKFIAEHNLSFDIAPHLINLAKELSRDLNALQQLQMITD